MRHRGLVKLGARNGLVRYRMELLPEISGKLESALAAVVSPKSAPIFLETDTAVSGDAAEGAEDGRSQAQKRHDAFASLIDAAARSGEVASMGGAAPTVTVTVAHEDLVCGRGHGHRGTRRRLRDPWVQRSRRVVRGARDRARQWRTDAHRQRGKC